MLVKTSATQDIFPLHVIQQDINLMDVEAMVSSLELSTHLSVFSLSFLSMFVSFLSMFFSKFHFSVGNPGTTKFNDDDFLLDMIVNHCICMADFPVLGYVVFVLQQNKLVYPSGYLRWYYSLLALGLYHSNVGLC